MLSNRAVHTQNKFLLTSLLLLARWRLGFIFYWEKRPTRE
jgi:hypothetical protein